MPIELLYIIPAVAIALFFLILMRSTQKQDNSTGHLRDNDLVREVNLFNRGYHTPPPSYGGSEKRLGEIEKTIELVTTALSNQQKVIENYKGKDENYVRQLNGLKTKLMELQHEYDILLSENYSLRARINNISSNRNIPEKPEPPKELPVPRRADTDTFEAERAQYMRLYDDTRTFKTSDFGDSSEINLSELK
ncbi:MAG: hypothetical protein GF344_02445 [Chitinivibrionales bacterium]|nr:hypothetical protein [Chitinivibrionales bacterium]